VVELTARYLRPVDYDDELLIRVRVAERGNAAVTLEYEVRRATGADVTATGTTRLACVGRDGRLRRLPKEI
jgi:acyl-CoA thioester hydrolase